MTRQREHLVEIFATEKVKFVNLLFVMSNLIYLVFQYLMCDPTHSLAKAVPSSLSSS